MSIQVDDTCLSFQLKKYKPMRKINVLCETMKSIYLSIYLYIKAVKLECSHILTYSHTIQCMCKSVAFDSSAPHTPPPLLNYVYFFFQLTFSTKITKSCPNFVFVKKKCK